MATASSGDISAGGFGAAAGGVVGAGVGTWALGGAVAVTTTGAGRVGASGGRASTLSCCVGDRLPATTMTRPASISTNAPTAAARIAHVDRECAGGEGRGGAGRRGTARRGVV